MTINRNLTEENFEEWNEQMARRYDVDQFHSHPSVLIQFIEGRRVAAVIDFLEAKSGEGILEVGCGAGNILQKISCGILHGIDLSKSLIERAKKRLGSRAEILHGNAEVLPYKDNSFDKIYCSEVLEHVMNPQKVLEQIVRVAKPGAKVVVSIPHEKLINFCKGLLMRLHLFKKIFKSSDPNTYQMHERMQDEWHLHQFSLSLLKSFVPASLVEERVKRIPFFFLPLRYVVRYQVLKNV